MPLEKRLTSKPSSMSCPSGGPLKILSSSSSTIVFPYHRDFQVETTLGSEENNKGPLDEPCF